MKNWIVVDLVHAKYYGTKCSFCKIPVTHLTFFHTRCIRTNSKVNDLLKGSRVIEYVISSTIR